MISFLRVCGSMVPMTITNNGVTPWADRADAISLYVEKRKQEQQQQQQHQKQQQQRKQQQQQRNQITQHQSGTRKRQVQEEPKEDHMEPEEAQMTRKIPKIKPQQQIDNLHNRVTEVSAKLKNIDKIIIEAHG